MKWKFLNVPLGASAPYGNSRKCVGEDAIVGLGTSVLSGLFGMMNTDNTNAANRAMAHETNQYNYSINMANRELQRDMFYQQLAESRLQREQDRNWYLQDIADERAYNDPSAIAARLRAAGINPALAMQSGQLGHSGGSGVMSNPGTSVPSFQAPQTIPMQTGAPMIPYDGFGLMAKNIGEILLTSKRQEADIAALRARTQLEAIETFSKAIQRGFENDKIKADMNRTLQDFQFNQRNMVELDRNIKLANDKIAQDMEYQKSLKALNDQALQLNINADARAWKQLSGFLAGVNADIGLKGAQSGYYKTLEQKTSAEYTGVVWDNKKKEFDYDDTRLKEIYDSDREYWNNILNDQRYDRNYAGFRAFVRAVNPLIPMAPSVSYTRRLGE